MNLAENTQESCTTAIARALADWENRKDAGEHEAGQGEEEEDIYAVRPGAEVLNIFCYFS